MNKIRIESDGTPHGVKVTDAETGAIVPGVRSVTWQATAGEMPTVWLEIHLADVDLIGERDAVPIDGDEKSGYFYTVSGPVTHFPPIE
jgi:hypothetical protein